MIYFFHFWKTNILSFLWYFCWALFLLLLLACSQTEETPQTSPPLTTRFNTSCDSLPSRFTQLTPDQFQSRFGYSFESGKTNYLSLWLLGHANWNQGTSVWFIGACPEFTWRPQPDFFVIVQKTENHFEKPARIDEARLEDVLFVNPVTDGIETLYQDRLWLRFLRYHWYLDAESGHLQSSVDTLSESQFRAEYPRAAILEWAENDRLEPIEKKTLFDSYCDLDLDGVKEHILITDSTGRHIEENILEYFCVLKIYKTNPVTDSELLWILNDKLIPSSDESEQITGGFLCGPGQFSFSRTIMQQQRGVNERHEYFFKYNQDFNEINFWGKKVYDLNGSLLSTRQDGPIHTLDVPFEFIIY